MRVNLFELKVGDYIKDLGRTVVGIKHVKGGRYKTIKQNVLVTLDDGRIILARQELILNVHASGKLTVPWKREVVKSSVEVDRKCVDPK